MTNDDILDANRRAAIDGDLVRAGLLEIQSLPDRLLDLGSSLLDQCEVQSFGWLLPPICGWLPLASLDELAARAKIHGTAHPDCRAAEEIDVHHRLRRLGQDAQPTSHVAFPEALLNEWASRNPFRTGHPTWKQAVGATVASVGGATEVACPRCSVVCECLLRIPANLIGGEGTSPVSFVWCPGCSPFTDSALARRHDDGAYHLDPPELIQGIDVIEVLPIDRIDVSLVDLGPEWRNQDWMWSNGVENLHRIGGFPTWIQHPTTPGCPDCQAPMRFVAQIAVEDLYDGEGLTYLHWCEDCDMTGVVYQQT